MLQIAPQSRLIFIGDSVTDVGRVQPVAEGLFNPLGQGYPNLVNALLTATYPERNIHVINVGSNGHTVRNLAERWERDVIALKPDYLSICIGINDVWRHFDSPTFPADSFVELPEYEATLRKLIEQTQPLLKGGLVLMTPHYLEPNRNDLMRHMMDQYADVVRRLAGEYGTMLVDTQAVFDALLATKHSSYFAWDRVHPNTPGHMAIAREWLKVVGYEW